MTDPRFISELRKQQELLYSIDINGTEVKNEHLLLILIRKLELLNPPTWLDQNKLTSHLDIRYQLFVKIESATVHYYQSIKSTIRDIENIWDDTKALGYLDEMALNIIIFREVSLRTSFLEKIFFEVDYFIQRMNFHKPFNPTGSIHKKQQYFLMLMTTLGIENKSIDTDSIVDDLNGHIITEDLKGLFIKKNNRSIKLSEFYTYLVAMRNAFHNNGYSQKSMNNMDIGGVKFEIKKNQQLLLSHDVVVAIVYAILYPLEEIVNETFKKYPNEFWEDPYTKAIADLGSK